ncbi:MAG: hypothetical protein ACJA08_000964 [Cyclobacteriaceae bacterium]|jgi:hypothetical protein
MENSWYSFDLPFGWVALALLIGALLAFFLYSKKNVPWTRNVSLLLGALRMMSLFLIALLLLNPLLRLSINHTDRPIVVLALDNSESISLRTSGSALTELKQWFTDIFDQLDENYEVGYKDLNLSKIDTITFDSKTTNLGELLQNIEIAYEGENVTGIVLASDGIINEGSLPQYRNYKYPVFTLGLGDTIAPKDVAIREVRNNKIAYQGNKFPIRIELQHKGFEGAPVNISITEKGKVLDQKTITLSKLIQAFDFNLEATDAGLKHLVINLTQLDGESSFVNNRKDVYINVIEGKEKILIVAPAPHPDISAIRKVLSNSANYETEIYIPGVSEKNLDKKYDVLIEHNAFSGSKYPKVEVTGCWYILGSKSLPKLNDELSYFNIQQRGRQTDNVRPGLVQTFSKYKLNADNLKNFENYPPLTVPFGEYGVSGPVDVMLTQMVGSIDTGKPLMFYYDDGLVKSAVTVGSGIWQWRLQEAGLKEKSELFDELVLKTIQFLSIKSDKKQFVVKPRQSTFNENDRVYIDTELYNEIYERSYGNTIELRLTDEAGKANTYQLVDSEVTAAFNFGRMDQGVYQYVATTKSRGKTLTEKGEFIVNQTQIEGLNLQADHQLLRQISQKSGGKFYHFSERNQLSDQLKNAGFKSLIRTEEELFPLINSLLVIGLIMLFLTTEWFFRKYLGAY